MFSSEILEIVIGLVFIYLILSLLCTTITELIAGLLRLRGRDLRKSLMYLLYDGNATKADYKAMKEIDYDSDDPADPAESANSKAPSSKVYISFIKHPLFFKLQRNSRKKFPSYVSSSTFSKVLYEVLAFDNTYEKKKELDKTIAKIKGPLGKLLRLYWEETGNDVEKFKKKLEEWYDEMQTRVAGWYKRRIQWILLIISFMVALAVNADTFSIVEKVSGDSKARRALVELAIKQSQQIGPEYFPENEVMLESDADEVDELLVIEPDDSIGYSYEDFKQLTDKTHQIINEQLSEVNNIMGMGWNTMKESYPDKQDSKKTFFWWYFKKFFGLLITAIALSLGANFWFDLLQKAINIKHSGGLPAKPKPGEQDSNNPNQT